MQGQLDMNYIGKIMVAKIEKISVPECKICSKGIDGVPNCKIGECDLPIELENEEYGKIGVLAAKLEKNKWDFPIDKDNFYDTYFFLAFGENWEEIERVYRIPREDVEKHLEETDEKLNIIEFDNC